MGSYLIFKCGTFGVVLTRFKGSWASAGQALVGKKVTLGGKILWFYAFTPVFSMPFTVERSPLLSVNRDQ